MDYEKLKSADAIEEIIALHKEYEAYKREWHTITFEEWIRKKLEIKT